MCIRDRSEIDEILKYQRAVGLPVTLAEVGVNIEREEQLRTIAERAVIPGESSHNEPFPVSAEAIMAAMKSADFQGRKLL